MAKEKGGQGGPPADYLEELAFHAFSVNPNFPLPISLDAEGGINLSSAAEESAESLVATSVGFGLRDG